MTFKPNALSRPVEKRLTGTTLSRNADAGIYVETFLVSAVAAILAIRFFLRLSGYPQVGGNGLHIAHMLWGGLLMLIALIALLSFLSRRTRYIAALLGGIGFGTFIDELGKFITSDNDYFFQPTVALIYVIFVLLFMATRAIPRLRPMSQDEYLLNAIETLKSVAAGEAGRKDVTQALDFLQRSDPANPLVAPLSQALSAIDTLPERAPGRYVRLKRSLSASYQRVLHWPWFTRAVAGFFILNAISAIINVSIEIIQWLQAGGNGFLTQLPHGFSLIDTGQAIASLASGALTVIGASLLRRSRLAAYRMFERALLVSILFTQVFTFYEQQFSALVMLGFDLLLLLALGFMISQEPEQAGRRPAGRIANELLT